MGTEDGEDEKEGERSCGGFGPFSDTAWGKNDHFEHFPAPLLHFSYKNRNSSACLDYRVCAKGSRSRKDSTKGEIMDLRSAREVATLRKILYI